MSTDTPSKAVVLLKLAGAAAVLGALKLLFPGGKAQGGLHRGEAEKPFDGHSRDRDLITYGVGYGLALLMTCAAFALVHWRWTSGTTALGFILALALFQAIVHFRCFLHIDLKCSARDDLQLILFSTLIVALMVSGTLIVLMNLRMRMM